MTTTKRGSHILTCYTGHTSKQPNIATVLLLSVFNSLSRLLPRQVTVWSGWLVVCHQLIVRLELEDLLRDSPSILFIYFLQYRHCCARWTLQNALSPAALQYCPALLHYLHASGLATRPFICCLTIPPRSGPCNTPFRLLPCNTVTHVELRKHPLTGHFAIPSFACIQWSSIQVVLYVLRSVERSNNRFYVRCRL